MFYDPGVHYVCLTRYDLCKYFHHNEEQDGRCYSLGKIVHSFLLHLLSDH